MKEYPKFISKDDINTLPMMMFTGRLEVIEDLAHATKVIDKLRSEKILGFDTETRPSFTKGEFHPVALIQLATTDCAYLFRLNKMPFPKDLLDLFSSPDIIKAGVAILDDLRGIQKMIAFEPQGFVDLSTEVKKKGFESLGLRALTAIFLQKRLSKAAKITNWEKDNLSDDQLKYAANDALAGLLIYKKLLETL